MAGRRVKTDISDEKFKAAIEMIEAGNNTKKSIYEFLGVGSYATAEKRIQEWKDEQEMREAMRKKKRGTSIEGVELANIIEGYLSGDSFETVADRHYRSTAMIRNTLERVGALLRVNETVDPLNPPALPEEAMSEVFVEGEHVWLPAYQCMAVVKKEVSPGVYRCWTLDEGLQQNVHVHNWDMGSMKHLVDLGVSPASLGYNWSREDVVSLVNEALRKAFSKQVKRSGKD